MNSVKKAARYFEKKWPKSPTESEENCSRRKNRQIAGVFAFLNSLALHTYFAQVPCGTVVASFT